MKQPTEILRSDAAAVAEGGGGGCADSTGRDELMGLVRATFSAKGPTGDSEDTEEQAMNDLGKIAAGERILTLQQEKILAGVRRQAPSKLCAFQRAYSGAASKRQAIKAKCLDCSNLTVDEVRHCTVTGCPLWAYRPYQKSTEPLL